jgi:hypothetical protein
MGESFNLPSLLALIAFDVSFKASARREKKVSANFPHQKRPRSSINLSKKKQTFDSSSGPMIWRNAIHGGETMALHSRRITSRADPSDYLQHFDALEHADGKSIVVEIQFS